MLENTQQTTEDDFEITVRVGDNRTSSRDIGIQPAQIQQACEASSL